VTGLLGRKHDELTRKAALLPPGSGGVLALDWLNGCRTPLMDGRLSGSFIGLTLNTKPEQLYRALLEATAFGLRWIVETLREAGVPVLRFVASGGLPAKSPLLMQIYADVLGEEIRLAASDHSVALGAAILGRLAAETHGLDPKAISDAILQMAPQRSDTRYRPRRPEQQQYDALYALYRSVGSCDGQIAAAMRELRKIGTVVPI
jgi:L-ribulokinase